MNVVAPQRPWPTERLARVPEYVEAALAAVLSATLSVVVPTICVLGAAEALGNDAGPSPAAAVPAALLLVTLPLSVQCLFLVGRALTRGSLPFGPAAARHHPRWPAPLRPPIALYWLGHFLLAAALAHGFHVTGGRSIFPTSLAILLAFVLTAAANVCLVFAIAAVAPRSPWIDRVWRSRLLLDAAVTFIAFFFARSVGA
jgi:hypothetical protein